MENIMGGIIIGGLAAWAICLYLDCRKDGRLSKERERQRWMDRVCRLETVRYEFESRIRALERKGDKSARNRHNA